MSLALDCNAQLVLPRWKIPYRFTLAETIDHLLEAASRHPRLSASQEIILGRQIRAWQDFPGGPEEAPPLVQKRGRRALEKFLLCNLRLAHFISRRYQNRGVPMEDLMQCASEGLLQAYKRFDPSKGYRSSSYACWWAQQACQIVVAQQGNGLRLPTTVSEQLRKATRVAQILRARLNREPTDAELEEALDLKPGGISELRGSGRRADVRSLDALLPSQRDEGTGHTLLDITQGNEDPAIALERQEIQSLLSDLVENSPALSAQQRFLLRCRYFHQGKPPSIARLASQLNMNRETLRRMERAALEILKGLLPETTAAYRSLL
jgi:RNA polymerase sigma factor (sigma-70 family)